MGVLVLLFANQDPAFEVGPAVVQRLVALGVTDLAVLGDDQTTAVTLTGWAFDPSRSAEAAAQAVAESRCAVRVLHPVLESAIHRLPAKPQGDTR